MVAVLWTLPKVADRCLKNNHWWVFKKFCDIGSIGVSVWAIFVASSEFPQIKQKMITVNKMNRIEPLETLINWIQTEVRVFFVLIFVACFFLLLSMFRRPNNIFKEQEEEAPAADDENEEERPVIFKQNDFVKEYTVTFQIFNIFGALPVVTLLQMITGQPSGLEKTILLGFLALQVLCFLALVTAVFVKKPSANFQPGDHIKLFLKFSSLVFLVAWLAGFVALQVLNKKFSMGTAEWMLSCVGITTFVQLSIFEDKPHEYAVQAERLPSTSSKKESVNQPFLAAINGEEKAILGSRVTLPREEGVLRVELKEDYYAMTWCAFQKKYQIEYALTQSEVYTHFFKAACICATQAILVFLVYQSMHTQLSQEVPYSLVIMRFICVTLLHVQIEQEVR